VRLASKNQLWQLNRAGRLAVVEKAEPLSAEDAWNLIAEELAAYGLDSFPKPGERWPERKR
jgi:hypothetical protein